MLSSIGFHTLSLYKKLTNKEAGLLYMAFKDHNDAYIIPDKNNKSVPKNNNDPFFFSFSNYYYVIYNDKNKGLSWKLRTSVSSPYFRSKSENEHKPCSIQVKINPKIFTGITDYTATSAWECLKDVETRFNLEANKISPVLGDFGSYLLNRIDYCVNFHLKELCRSCTPEQVITLFKRGNIPERYEERKEYDYHTSHRNKTDKNTFYLQSKSVTVNCYWKYYQLQKEFLDCPDIDNSLDVIRFEIQCKYLKVYSMSKNLKESMDCDNPELISSMLSDDVSNSIVTKYYNKIIRKGDYYPLETAKRIVRDNRFQSQKEERLINALNLINRCRGISKAKAELRGEEFEDFKRSMRELEALGINPVTIPREWGIRHIPNLLDTYNTMFLYEKLSEIKERWGL